MNQIKIVEAEMIQEVKNPFLILQMKSNFFKISLNGLEFNSKIGYHKQEQIDGNLFLVNLDLHQLLLKIIFSDLAKRFIRSLIDIDPFIDKGSL